MRSISIIHSKLPSQSVTTAEGPQLQAFSDFMEFKYIINCYASNTNLTRVTIVNSIRILIENNPGYRLSRSIWTHLSPTSTDPSPPTWPHPSPSWVIECPGAYLRLQLKIALKLHLILTSSIATLHFVDLVNYWTTHFNELQGLVEKKLICLLNCSLNHVN